MFEEFYYMYYYNFFFYNFIHFLSIIFLCAAESWIGDEVTYVTKYIT